MIKVEFYVHVLGDGKRMTEFSDMSLTHIYNESLSVTNDIHLIFDALQDGLQDLSPEAWYEAEVERRTEIINDQIDTYFVVLEVSVIDSEDIFIDDDHDDDLLF